MFKGDTLLYILKGPQKVKESFTTEVTSLLIIQNPELNF